MKLMAKDLGNEKDKRTTSTTRSTTSAYYVEDEPHMEEINLIEDALDELQSDDLDEYDADNSQVPEDEILDEHEVAEVLNTMIHRKKTFVQSAKIKKAKELARGWDTGTKTRSVLRIKKPKVSQETHYVEKMTGPVDTEEAIFCGFLTEEIEVPPDYNVIEPNKFPESDHGGERLHVGNPLLPSEHGGDGFGQGHRNLPSTGEPDRRDLLPGDRHLSAQLLSAPRTALDDMSECFQSEASCFDHGSAKLGAYMSDSTSCLIRVNLFYAMESNKRVRTELPAWAAPDRACSRMVLKLIFLMTRVTSMLTELLRGKDLRAAEEMDEEVPKALKQPFSAWPLTRELKAGTFSDVADSDYGFSVVRGSPSPSVRSGTVSPLALDIDHFMAKGVEQTYPLCAHGEVCDLLMCRKQNHNFQRLFWRCPLPIGQQCEMFQWAAHQPYWKEEDNNLSKSARSTGYSPGSSRTRGPSQAASTTPTSQVAPTTPSEMFSQNTQSNCSHTGGKCRSGTNGNWKRVRCNDCGMLLVDRRKTAEEIEQAQKEAENEKIRKNAKKNPPSRGTASSSTPTPPFNQEEMDEFEAFKEFRRLRRQQPDPDQEGMDQ
eukprot:s3242_g11.t1